MQEEWCAEPKREKWYKRLKCYCDFHSYIKSIWITGYLLITWEWHTDNGLFDHAFRDSLSFSWYSSGSYE